MTEPGELDRGAVRGEVLLNPAERLEGITLKNGWRVVERAGGARRPTGGCFSVGYTVESPSGQRAFLKAFDFFSQISQWEDPARELQPLLEAYNHERDLLNRCRDRKMSRIVRAIDDGTVTVPGDTRLGPVATVQYLIFELAEGDVRKQLDATNTFDVAWALRALHQIATGLEQLHRSEVVHQDLKPSNVLMFEKRTSNKLADLGRATAKGVAGPNDDLVVAGDLGYSPPDNLYGVQCREWSDRMARDAYHLGSMITFFFAQASMTALLGAFLDPKFRWDQWGGSFEEALPYVRAAFDKALENISPWLPEPHRPELLSMIRELCDPDPRLRGHSTNRRFGRNPYSLERYVSALNLLATRAEVALRAT